MYRIIKKTTLYLFMMVALIACGGDEDDDETDSGKKPDYIVAYEEIDLLESNETTLSIKANCKWVLLTDVDWLFLDPASGEDNANITITANQRGNSQKRSGGITKIRQKRNGRNIAGRQKAKGTGLFAADIQR